MGFLSIKSRVYTILCLNTGISTISFAISYLFLVHELGFTNDQATLLDMYVIITKLIFDIPTGLFADRISKNLSQAIGQSAYIISCCIGLFASEYWLFVLGSVIYGIGVAFISGAESSWIYDHFRKDQKRLYINLQLVNNGLSIFMPIIATTLSILFGFRFVFFIEVIVRAYIAIQFIWLYRHTKNIEIKHPDINFKVAIRYMAKSPPILLNIPIYFLWGFGSYAIIAYFPIIVESLGGLNFYGLISGTYSIAAIIGVLIARKIKNDGKAYWIGFLGNSILILFACFFINSYLFIPIILLRNIAFFIHDTYSSIMINKAVRKYKSSVFSILGLFSAIGAILAPLIMGKIVDNYGVSITWLISGIIFLILSYLFYLFQKMIKPNL